MTETIAINPALQTWITDNLLNVEILNDKVIKIDGVGTFLVVEPKALEMLGDITPEAIFDSEFQIVLSDEESNLTGDVDYLLFKFGDNWYYTNDLVPDEIKIFKYLGKAVVEFPNDYPYLGIHSGHELCNGSRSYDDWIEKAQFLGIETLGICEQNTLSGAIEFQEACKKAKIKSIIGETLIVLTETKAKIPVKLYVQNEVGWRNLLWINKLINVDNGGEFITEAQLLSKMWDGLACVVNSDMHLQTYLTKFDKAFKIIHYQLDFVKWDSDKKDEEWLSNLKIYLVHYSKNITPPVLISDSYYLDKSDSHIKKSLNAIGKVGFKNNSSDQYFKPLDEIWMQLFLMVRDEDQDKYQGIFDKALANTRDLCEGIDFKIPVGLFRLPKYELSEDEASVFATPDDLFWALIDMGIEEKITGKVDDEEKYLARVAEEIETIQAGGFIDYFLILQDILREAKQRDILYGIGRGSAAGSLVSYLLGIVGINPIKYGLLFSRFLNKGRLGKSLPDIDLDFQGERRDEIKRYIEEKYGAEYVTAIGTYGTLKVKSALKDLCRDKGVDYSKTNIVAGMLEGADMKNKMDGITITELFKFAAKKPELKEFIQKNYDVVEKFPLLLNQPKTASIHASGVVIVPKSYGSIFEQMPVRSVEGVLVSEWEGEIIDKAGFLKCDILGIKQLDKISAIFKLIKLNHGKDLEFTDIDQDLENENVFALFKDGYTEDVFQFGSAGLKAYCKEMKPDNINDLIAAVALYRPGPMDTRMHKKYIKVKNGEQEAEYDDGTFNATKETFGIAVYQEQVMQICVDVAGFDEVEADDVRKAMGKKVLEILLPYKEKFVAGGIKNGFDNDKLLFLWDKLETFARYGFNKSHAAAYAITGYYCQWLKYMYPIEFWTISMQYAETEDVINRIGEITKISDIQVRSVDINKSVDTFFSDLKTKEIFWKINSVKWVGDKAVTAIIEERTNNGEFYSIEEFLDRMTSKALDTDGTNPVNKRVIVNLILAGAFDKIETINSHERGKLLKKVTNFTTHKLVDELAETATWTDYQWVMRQKELTGFGFIDYEKIIKSSHLFATKQKLFLPNADVLFANAEEQEDAVVAGILVNVIERKSKKGPFGQLELIDNTDTLYITLWNDVYEPYKESLMSGKGKIAMVLGRIEFDDYKKINVLRSKGSTKIEII